ncbi:MAG: type I DNA topoisomerase [Ruminococcaceae bacterium]|nr:type I DNA topoisomerase [Oscillospiraceae bacterium]
MNTLVIVESPYKANTIKSFLGKGYKVKSSKGHVRDLPKSKLGIDIENDFEPQYINIRGKGELINELRKEAKSADRVFLAADPDREGEAISWHLANVLALDPSKTKRITFNEVTKNAVKEAIKNPRDIDMNLVNSQQTRRILDRLVGYKISPFLWRHIKNGLSAGRVQSVATRIVVEREQEIDAFVPEEFWVIGALFVTDNGEVFKAKYFGRDGKKTELQSEAQVKSVLEAIANGDFIVTDVKRALKLRRPAPPFITSTLQQEANRKLSFQSQKTMLIAQELYEGVNIGEKSTHGLITYMRTDSLRISDEAREAAKNVIINNYGSEYYPQTPNKYKLKKNAQDAHEAIRPTDPSITPDSLRGKISNDQYKLYKLIWERFIASQMSPEQLDTVSADIVSNGVIFRANGHTVKFKGFAAVYGDIADDSGEEESGAMLPELVKGEKVIANSIEPEQKFTQPPARFTEGSLVKVLEEKGIGRPSTYTATITTIISRGYIRREGKFLLPTELGVITTETMKKAFSHIVDYKFTAEMEEDLDKIEDGTSEYIAVLHEFYRHFSKQLEEAEKTLGSEKIELPKVETGIICEKCGAVMVEKTGRYGKFAACPNYPKCRNTKRLDTVAEKEESEKKTAEVIADEKCSKCGSDMVLRKGPHGNFFACRNYPECKTAIPYRRDSGIACPDCGKRIMIKQTKSRKTYYSCEDYPTCGFSSWDLPTERKCPQCNAAVLKKKNREFYYCKNECGWTEGK